MIVALLIVVILLAVLGLLFYWLKTKKSVKAKEENVNYGFNIRSNSGNLEDMPTYAYTYSPKVFRFYHKIDRDAILFSLDKISETYFDIITSNINDGAGTEFMVVIYE